MTPAGTARRVLFTAQKNEGPFILEWLALHKVVGFTRIIVFSNDCSDSSDDLLDVLDEAGEVAHFRQTAPGDVPPQLNAARLALERGLFTPGDWVMWLDLDEYLYIRPGGHTLDDLLAEIGEADAVAFCWRIFGDGGNAVWPGRQISRRFTRASKKRFQANSQTKTLFRYSEDIEALHVHRPVFRAGTDPEAYRIVHGGNRRLPPEYLHRRFRDGSPFHRVQGVSGRYSLGQVNHYAVRTRDMFARKMQRGNGLVSSDSSTAFHLYHQSAAFFDRYNRNDVEEDSILALAGRLEPELRRLQDLTT
ncbi:MAG: glycosyltransferase family 2 protein [Paracoccaceae bacterium]